MSTLSLEFSIPEGTIFTCSPMGLERLDVESPVPSTPDDPDRAEAVDWDEIHKLIQEVFGKMADEIRRRQPSIRSREGRASGRSFPLYTYRTFDLGGDDEMDAVIVGIIFEPDPSGGFIVVRGDIGGEESGRIDFEAPEKKASASRRGLIPTAFGTALELAAQWPLVVTAVLDRPRPPDY